MIAALVLAGLIIAPTGAAAAQGPGIDLSGRWLLQYSLPGIDPHPYTIELARAADDECVAGGLASPCYGGSWWNVTATRVEEPALFAATPSGSQLVLDGSEPAGGAANHYHGTSQTAAAPIFGGSYDSQAGTTLATFTFARTPYAPGAFSSLTAYPAAVDLEGVWRLDYTPNGQGTVPYTIDLTRRPDDLCADAFEVAPPCFGGTWFNVQTNRPEGHAYFTAAASAGSLVLHGAEGTTSPLRYQGTAPDLSSRTCTGTFYNDAGTVPATFTFTLTGRPVLAPLHSGHGDVDPGNYFVISRGTPDPDQSAPATLHAREQGITIDHEYRRALYGYSAHLSDDQLAAVRHDADVEYVAPAQLVASTDAPGPSHVQDNAPWNLDRIDQRTPPLDGKYVTASQTGTGVTVYVVDEGIRTDHPELGGRATAGYDVESAIPGSVDCSGHGTAMASIIGGEHLGVAKGVHLVSVKIARCGHLTNPTPDIAAGIEWVIANHRGPSVINYSQGEDVLDENLSDAMRNAIDAGIVVVAAAGDHGGSACEHAPNDVPDVITVAATDRADHRSEWPQEQESPYGRCIDVFAPGSDIPEADSENVTTTKIGDGTSQSAAETTGVAALYLQAHPGASVETVGNAIITLATPDQVTDATPATYARDHPDDISPNRLLYSRVTRTLTGVAVTFHTTHDDKDADTNVLVKLVTDSNTEAGEFTVPNDHFNDPSDAGPFQMTLTSASTVSSDLIGASFQMQFDPNGGVIYSRDEWDFDCDISLKFDDGTADDYYILEVESPSAGGELDWTLPGPTGS